MDKIDSTIGKSIRHYCWLQGVSREDLAATLGISVTQLRSHEAGKSRVSAARLLIIADHLGVDVAAFFQRNPDVPLQLPQGETAKMRGAGGSVQSGKYLAALMTHFQRLNDAQKHAVLQMVVSISKEGPGAEATSPLAEASGVVAKSAPRPASGFAISRKPTAAARSSPQSVDSNEPD